MPNLPTHIKRIMLIDDSDIDLKINAKLLSIHFPGISLTTHICAEEGISYLKKYMKQPDLLPDCILLDIQMPNMDGFSFLDIYKTLDSSLTDLCTVLILSSTLDFGDTIRAEANSNVFRMLKKPLKVEDLIKTFAAI